MDIPLLGSDAKQAGKTALPSQFSEPVRVDLIKRSVEVTWANSRQPYGSDPRAGKRYTAKLSKRRRAYRGMYGKGISRVPRKIVSRNGANMNWIGAFAPSCVGGFRAHPPKAGKRWEQKINRQERRMAIRSALAATVHTETVRTRNKIVPSLYPFALDASAEQLVKTSAVVELLEKAGLGDELVRCQEKKIRPGKGKARGRPYRRKTGPLLVVSKACPLSVAARSIPGIDVTPVRQLSASLLAPGASPGRLTIFTKEALVVLEKERLYT